MSELDLLFNGWAWAAILLVFISGALAGIVYMLGNLLLDDKMKTWAKMEFFEVLYSMILLGAILVWVNSFDSITYGLLHDQSSVFPLTKGYFPTAADPSQYELIDICPTDSASYNSLTDPLVGRTSYSVYNNIPYCHIRLSIYFLDVIFKELSDSAFTMFQSYMVTSTLADFSINIEFLTDKAGHFTFTPWRGFFTMDNNMKMLGFDFATKLMTITQFQRVLIAFISKAIFPNLFIIGLILRTFAFTRRLGGLLMAIALALFYIYPMFYVFGAMVVNSIQYKVAGHAQHVPVYPAVANHLYVNGTVPLLTGEYDLTDAERQYRNLLSESASATRNRFSEGDRSDTDTVAGSIHRLNLDIPETTAELNNRNNALDDATLEKLRETGTVFTGEIGKKQFNDNFIKLNFENGGTLDVLARLAFFSMFFSFFGVLATIACVRSLSITLGGDVEIAGLTHLI